MKISRHISFAVAIAALGCAGYARASNILDTTATPLYHLNASVGITTNGSGVSNWADANANGVNFAQSTTTKEPTLLANSANFNNKPVVTFSGNLAGNSGGTAPNASRLEDSASTTGVQTVVIIGRTTVFNNLSGIWGVDNGDNGIRMQSATTWQVNGGNGGNTNDFPTSMNLNGVNNAFSVPLNTPFVMVAEGSALSLAATGLGEYFNLGTNTPRPWGGDIAEMAVYNTALNQNSINAIDAYATATYGVVPEPASLGLLGLAALGLLGQGFADQTSDLTIAGLEHRFVPVEFDDHERRLCGANILAVLISRSPRIRIPFPIHTTPSLGGFARVGPIQRKVLVAIQGVICQACGIEAPAKYVEFHQNIGALVVRFSSASKGNMCKRCVHAQFWQKTMVTVACGWIGTISFVLAPIFVIMNIVRYVGALGMPGVPAGATPPVLTPAAMQNLNPLTNEIVGRLNNHEPLVSVAQDIAPRARVTPGQVVLFVVALADASRRPAPTYGFPVGPARGPAPLPVRPLPPLPNRPVSY